MNASYLFTAVGVAFLIVYAITWFFETFLPTLLERNALSKLKPTGEQAISEQDELKALFNTLINTVGWTYNDPDTRLLCAEIVSRLARLGKSHVGTFDGMPQKLMNTMYVLEKYNVKYSYRTKGVAEGGQTRFAIYLHLEEPVNNWQVVM